MTGRQSGSGHGERGSITIVAAGLLTLVLVLALGLADLSRVVVATAKAQTAADAAALAAAQELALPTGLDPPHVAADYAVRNGGILGGCSCPPGGAEATVWVRVSVGGLLLFADDLTVSAAARAVVDLPGG